MPLNVAWTITIDPDGAMDDWVDLPAGHALVKIPSQEAVGLLGIRGYQELVADVCAAEGVDVLVTHPPYDWLDEATAARLKQGGTKLVGYAFDDAIFGARYDAATRAALGRIYDRYATSEEVLFATRPLPALEPVRPEHDVVLVGRAYPRRVALVERLRADGVNVLARGDGWRGGHIPRQAMLDLYARSTIVLTTADWEDVAVPMVKHRLLETAMLGAFQVAQEAPDLRRYFPEDEVPSWRNPEDLVEQVRVALDDPAGCRRRAEAARARALAEHTWTVRFPELVAPLGPLPGGRPRGHSRLLDFTLLALAGRAESGERPRAAAALYRELLARVPDEPGALAGLGRCLRDTGALAEAVAPLRAAAAAPMPAAAAALDVGVPGVGRLGMLPPAAEPTCFLLATLVELERIDEALAVADAITNPAVGRAVARALDNAPEALRERLARFV